MTSYDQKTKKSLIVASVVLAVAFLVFLFFVFKALSSLEDSSYSYTPIDTTYITSFEDFGFYIDVYLYEDMCIVRSIEVYHPSYYTFVSAQYHFYPIVLSDGGIAYRLYNSNARGSDDLSYMIVTFYDEKQHIRRSVIMSMEDVLELREKGFPVYVDDGKTLFIHRVYLEPGAEIVFIMNSVE